MKLYKNVIFVILIYGFFLNFYAQLSDELKSFLWSKDFNELIREYSEENITLHNKGEIRKRAESRSYFEQSGLRIQTFAGTAKENAELSADELRAIKIDSVYIIQQNGLFKVQVGNYRDRRGAEEMLDRLRYAGFGNAWIVETTIHVPKDSTDRIGEVYSDSVQDISENLIYTIQLFVTIDHNKAQTLADEYAGALQIEVWVDREQDIWKVYAGKFEDEKNARNKLDDIRSAGFSDAWLTQVKE